MLPLADWKEVKKLVCSYLEKRVPSRKNRKCKVFEARVRLEYLRNNMKTSVVGKRDGKRNHVEPVGYHKYFDFYPYRKGKLLGFEQKSDKM